MQTIVDTQKLIYLYNFIAENKEIIAPRFDMGNYSNYDPDFTSTLSIDSIVNNVCGTSCCLAGWSALAPELKDIAATNKSWISYVDVFFPYRMYSNLYEERAVKIRKEFNIEKIPTYLYSHIMSASGNSFMFLFSGIWSNDIDNALKRLEFVINYGIDPINWSTNDSNWSDKPSRYGLCKHETLSKEFFEYCQTEAKRIAEENNFPKYSHPFADNIEHETLSSSNI